MNRRTRLLVSAIAGIAAAVISFTAISGAHQEAERARRETLEQYGGELVSVCVATRDIDPGEQIDDGNAVVTEWVSTLLPAEAVTSLADVAGRTATARIPAHAPLSEAYFEQRESAVDVPRGKVAVSVASDAEHAVGGVLERGDLVDVYVQGDALADKLTDAEVIDTSALASGSADVQWVTLAVRPSAVRELLAAASGGMVTLAVPAEQEDGDRDSDDAEESLMRKRPETKHRQSRLVMRGRLARSERAKEIDDGANLGDLLRGGPLRDGSPRSSEARWGREDRPCRVGRRDDEPTCAVRVRACGDRRGWSRGIAR